ncbi:MAG: SDR family oxidoreductase [Saprospiraceae bacterium]|nr:SDR family oxidoreductase [Saprospiraceae bacterium]
MISTDYFHDRFILVSGAYGGIGSACVRDLDRKHARVCLLGRKMEKLQVLKKSLENSSKHICCPLDLVELDSIGPTLEEVISEHGPFSGFIHAAGVEKTNPIRKTTHEDFLYMYKLNTISAFEIIKVLNKCRRNYTQDSSYILISSVAGMLATRGKSSYSSSKGALIALARTLALELAGKGIRLNTISPGIVETDLVAKMFEAIPSDQIQQIINHHPLGLGLPEDISNLCMFLLSRESRWMTGSNIVIDGGYSLE